MTGRQLNSAAWLGILLFLFAECALLFLTPRTETLQLLVVYLAMCGAYFFLYKEIRYIRTVAFLGVCARIISWLAFPALSDDIYRFIWDGAVILEGMNPYTQVPIAFFDEHAFAPFDILLPFLNSSSYYSVYPPIIQVISAFGALAANDVYLAALIIKLPILVAEIATIWMLPQVLMRLQVSPKYSILYMLNPLIIVDVVGNAHFEALMLLFLLLTIKWIQERRFGLAGVSLAFSIGVKVIPILILPFLLKAFVGNERQKFLSGFLPSITALFLPLLPSQGYLHYYESLRLYFQHFEFNASFYYAIRETGIALIGYNPIAIVGPALGASVILIMVFLWRKQTPGKLSSALRQATWLLTFYYLLATTVHPWYISTLILLGICTRQLFPLVWSVVIFLSYSAYEETLTHEYPWILVLEYLVLLMAIWRPKFFHRLVTTPIGRTN